MEQITIYSSDEYPAYLKCQTLSFLRMEWPEGFVGKNRLRDWITPEKMHPVHFVIVEGEILISHLEVVWIPLIHKGIEYKTYGLTGVLTYPQFRKQGFGSRLVKEATKYINKSDADIAMYHVGQDLVNFYNSSCGWEPIYKAKTLKGSKDNPVADDGVMMALFLSEKGKKGRKDFETIPFYFGEDTW